MDLSSAASPGGPVYHIEEYYDRLKAGDRTNIGRMFRGMPAIDDPRFGSVRSWPEYEEYVSASAGWLGALRAGFESVRSTLTPARAVLEGTLRLQIDGKELVLPAALVGDLFAGGLSGLRIYHSASALGLEERPRLRLSPIRQGLPTSVQRYWEALTAGDIDGVLKQLAPGGKVYGPASSQEVYAGREALRRYYLRRSAEGSPVRAEATSISLDSGRCAVEYNLIGMAGPPRPALSVFDLAPGDLIQVVRVYNDESINRLPGSGSR